MQPKRHFTLYRKSKAAAQRADLLQKSSSQGKHKKGFLSSIVPIRARSMVRKMDDTGEKT
ncbi:unnamed protein product [Soboliphyme baturini]|uniref:HDAg domain-containing protein n=1 Tax=Soboliphyme baturini TaxID=241478 RepID=A0A183JAN7_9BILA|nr:unnamed protein product [Soboliphyme baturini]